MSIQLRVMLIVASVLLLAYTFYKLRKTPAHVSDVVFWVISAVVLVIIALFPGIMIWLSAVLNIISPANLVFAIVIALLIIRVFLSSMDIAVLRSRVDALSQEVALKERELKDRENGSSGA